MYSVEESIEVMKENRMGTDTRKIEISDAEYPSVLREIPDPPKQLYVRGSLDTKNLPVVAVIGSRKPTDYGIRVTDKLVSQIAPHCIVISGLAYGIDALAHEAVLKAGGITWAILGTGADEMSIYPATHRGLARRIIEQGGAIISEYPDGTEPQRHHFPLRNRIIAGLSSKVVVVEAMAKSGALITGQLGLDYNREVLAVPGPITSPESEGANRLIADGARPVLTAHDIIEFVSTTTSHNLTGLEEIVYNTLRSSGGTTVDEIAQTTNLASREVSTVITMLEMKRLVSCRSGQLMVTSRSDSRQENEKLRNG